MAITLNFGRMTTKKNGNALIKQSKSGHNAKKCKKQEVTSSKAIKKTRNQGIKAYGTAVKTCGGSQKYRLIGSITSYPGRIQNVGIQVRLLMDQQTKKLDQLHIWLAEPQFPNKEKDLPDDLLNELEKRVEVTLHWLPEDTKVHKRHEIFKICEDTDLVFLFDDDCIYDQHLIESVVAANVKYPNAVIVYEKYDKHRYEGRHCLYKEGKAGGPYINVYRWCGQSMIPARVYPKEVLTDENQSIRNECSPVSDECWITPWLVFADTPMYYLHFGRTKNISKTATKAKGMCVWTHEIEANGYERRDNWLYSTLSSYPKMLKKYQRLFNYGE